MFCIFLAPQDHNKKHCLGSHCIAIADMLESTMTKTMTMSMEFIGTLNVNDNDGSPIPSYSHKLSILFGFLTD